jgi:predicted DCC family thiol-disulfide oxidoreductase YuxK
LFDGVCNLCNASVRFLIARDHRAALRFTSLQSDLGRTLIAQHELDGTGLDSVILVENGRAWVESEAALRIAMHLGWPWRAAGVLRLLPRRLRDAGYRLIARNRYRWFGKQDACLMPTPELRARFLD